MTFLTYILLTVSGIVSMAGAYDKPLSNDEIISVVTECTDAGLVYNSISTLTIQESRNSLAISDDEYPDGLTKATTVSGRVIKKQRLIKSSGSYYTYAQWCDAPSKQGYSGKRSYFKPVLTHAVLISKLGSCRHSRGVAEGTLVSKYAVLTVGNLTLQPTKVECL